MQLDTGIQGVALISANPNGGGVAAIARQTGSIVGVVRNAIGDLTLTTDPLSLLDFAPLTQAIVEYAGDVTIKVTQTNETTWQILTSADGAPADIDFFIAIVRYPASSGVFVPSAAPTPASFANGSLWARHVFGTGTLGDLVQAADNFAFLGGDFDNFTLDAGFTLTPPANRGILIRARQSIVINGTIDASSVNSNAELQAQDLFFGAQAHAAGGGGGASGDAVAGLAGAALPAIYQNLGFVGSVNSTPGIAGVGAGGAGGNAAGGTIGVEAIGLVRFWTDNGLPLPYCLGGLPGGAGGDGGEGGSAGGGGGAGGLGGAGGAGGQGGSYVALIAPSITFGAAAIVRANGNVGVDGLVGTDGDDGPGAGDDGGGGGGGGGGGQGGTGGLVCLLYITKTDAGATIEAVGGAGSLDGLGGAGGLGNAGGVAGGPGGAGGSPVVGGNIGRGGYVIERQLTPMP